MATHVTTGLAPVDEAYPGKIPTRLSWGAIFAGVVIAVAIQLVLGILGTGIGLTMVDPVEGTTPGAAGFGIGAYEARQLAEEMGGRLDVTSREGEGSRFRLTLPAAPALEHAA